MKNILHILVLLVTCVAVYFSFDNKAKFEEQIQVREETQTRSDRISANADKTQGELDDVLAKLEEAKTEKSEAEASIANLESKEASLKREKRELDARLEEQQATLAEAKRAFAEAKTVLDSLGIETEGEVTSESISGVISQLKERNADLEASIESLDTTIAKTREQIEANRDEIGRLQRKKAERNVRFRRNAMESIITAVDQNWGFVVIGAGRNSGFTPQTRLIVQRDGRVIAEVEPSSIEASQTIAEIDLDSLAPGVVIQPGDRVILSTPATN